MVILPSFFHGRKTYKLIQALYGLRQASHAWYNQIDSFFQQLGLHQSIEDPNLYPSHCNGKCTIILLHLDNIITTSNDGKHIQHLKQYMMGTFHMTDLGTTSYYLGVEIQQKPEGIYFHQKGYVEKLLDRFGMTDCTLMAVPMNPKTKLCKDTETIFVDPLLY